MTKRDAAKFNPCLKEGELSLKCLDRNNYVHDQCQDYFDNYNNCKKFWGKVYSDRKAKGIKPYLPVVEERDKVKAEYIKNVIL